MCESISRIVQINPGFCMLSRILSSASANSDTFMQSAPGGIFACARSTCIRSLSTTVWNISGVHVNLFLNAEMSFEKGSLWTATRSVWLFVSTSQRWSSLMVVMSLAYSCQHSADLFWTTPHRGLFQGRPDSPRYSVRHTVVDPALPMVVNMVSIAWT